VRVGVRLLVLGCVRGHVCLGVRVRVCLRVRVHVFIVQSL